MEWTETHDVLLCREMLVVQPYQFKKGSNERGKMWTKISECLNDCKEVTFKVNQRSVRERFALIQGRYKKKDREEQASSGISPEVTELDTLLEEISERERVAEETVKESESGRRKAESDRASAEEARKKAMERMGQTKKRKKEDGESSEVQPKRRKGSDTLEFLREKAEKELSLREKELEVKKAEQQQQQDMLQVMQKQVEQQQQQQVLLMQQQQQQNLAMMALIESLAKK